jgi:hypothetical protein
MHAHAWKLGRITTHNVMSVGIVEEGASVSSKNIVWISDS